MIEIGTTIILETEESEKATEKYRCRLIDREDTILMVDYPINQKTNKTGFFLNGTNLTASFIGKDGVMHKFQTEVVGRMKKNIPILLLKAPHKEGVIRIQRREYARVKTNIDVALHSKHKIFSPFVSMTIDLGGGGCLVVIPQGKIIPEKDDLILWLVLPMRSGELVYVKTSCEIIRLVTPDQERERVSLKFINMNESDREKIVRYCFERQIILQRMKKE